MSSLINKTDFLAKFRINDETFTRANVSWEELEKIYVHHEQNTLSLESVASYIVDRLRRVKEVHSLKFRVKDPEHLIEKIIRKKSDGSPLDYSLEKYNTSITDLIGIRVIHLFKEDWHKIHNFIMDNWDVHEKPTANIREGDAKSLVKLFQDNGCETKEHPSGYRSVHYLIKSQPSKNLFIAELQVRTIFEEGWSEIDHRIRYPYNTNNIILSEFLGILNRLAGSADEMGSFIHILEDYINDYKERIKDREEEVIQLNNTIQELTISSKEKEDLKTRVESVSKPVNNRKFNDKSILLPSYMIDSASRIDVSKLESFMDAINGQASMEKTAEKLNSLMDAINGQENMRRTAEKLGSFMDAVQKAPDFSRFNDMINSAYTEQSEEKSDEEEEE